MLLGTLSAILMGYIVTGRGIYRAGKSKGKGINRAGDEIVRAGYGDNNNIIVNNNNNNNNRLNF